MNDNKSTEPLSRFEQDIKIEPVLEKLNSDIGINPDGTIDTNKNIKVEDIDKIIHSSLTILFFIVLISEAFIIIMSIINPTVCHYDMGCFPDFIVPMIFSGPFVAIIFAGFVGKSAVVSLFGSIYHLIVYGFFLLLGASNDSLLLIYLEEVGISLVALVMSCNAMSLEKKKKKMLKDKKV